MFVLRGTIYHFRRRVPAALRCAVGRGEIHISLGTSVVRSMLILPRFGGHPC
ncbi:DUF6538 domain-containing protein [Azospirillum himalayense]|uniref:DUF6538 domain-containing protein n=1 Tax=Azospirillum himalayense TaxID=654847 RepID=A0ABW0G9Z7_9PROT